MVKFDEQMLAPAHNAASSSRHWPDSLQSLLRKVGKVLYCLQRWLCSCTSYRQSAGISIFLLDSRTLEAGRGGGGEMQSLPMQYSSTSIVIISPTLLFGFGE